MISMGLACLITLLALFLLKPFAEKAGLVDIPGGRKIHTHHTPLIGGIGVFIGMLSLAFVSWDSFQAFMPLYGIAGMLLIVGILDDRHDLPANIRLAVHLLAGTLMIYWGGNKLNSVGDLLFIGDISLGYLAVPFTLFCVACSINAVNMTDGVDGLLGGLTLVTLLLMGWLAYSAGLHHTFMFIGVLACCIIGFLALNFRFPWRQRAEIFMGDAGSTVIGFILAWLLIDLAREGACPPAVTLWLIALPLLDCACVMIKRHREGRGLFTAGRDHLHHFLLDIGFSVRQTVLIIYGLAFSLGLFGVLANELRLADGAIFVSFLGLLAAYVVAIPKLSRALHEGRLRKISSR